MSGSRKSRGGRPSKYPPQFQREAVDLVLSSGRTIKEVADSLGINGGTLSNWVRAARDAQARAEDPEGNPFRVCWVDA